MYLYITVTFYNGLGIVYAQRKEENLILLLVVHHRVDEGGVRKPDVSSTYFKVSSQVTHSSLVFGAETVDVVLDTLQGPTLALTGR